MDMTLAETLSNVCTVWLPLCSRNHHEKSTPWVATAPSLWPPRISHMEQTQTPTEPESPSPTCRPVCKKNQCLFSYVTSLLLQCCSKADCYQAYFWVWPKGSGWCSRHIGPAVRTCPIKAAPGIERVEYSSGREWTGDVLLSSLERPKF